MKDLQQFYMRLASALERVWTSREDKRHAAILLRNAAVDTPHCHFCGIGPSVELYESPLQPEGKDLQAVRGGDRDAIQRSTALRPGTAGPG
jgi:hypothetical protein